MSKVISIVPEISERDLQEYEKVKEEEEESFLVDLLAHEDIEDEDAMST